MGLHDPSYIAEDAALHLKTNRSLAFVHINDMMNNYEK